MSIGGLNTLARNFWRIAKRAGKHLRRHANGLDLETLSDDQKRDMGFADGRRPYREDPLC